MHNTSERFYRYIGQNIINHLIERRLDGGERFNLYIEQQEAVLELFNNIKREFEAKVSSFEYKHEKGKDFFTSYTIDIGDSDLLVVASDEEVREDFITTLRNKIAKQEGLFEGKNLLILFSGRLDSLLGGSESFLKEGMPLNGKVFRKKLEGTIIHQIPF
jgi:DNA phosphorothioation-dependent restriction protein DptH